MFRKLIALVSALLLFGGVARADSLVVLRLPAPTGPHPVGSTVLHLVDHNRTDPWNPALEDRDVMVTVFYPASDVRGHPVAPHMTAVAAQWFRAIDLVYMHPELTAAKDRVDWAATKTHSHPGAPAQAVKRPVLLYSTGGGDPRALGSGLAEELASRGYVVVTIDHPGETSEVEIPGRPVRTVELTGDPGTDPVVFRKMITTRLADTKFVLDRLEHLNPDVLPKNLTRALDLRRIGMYGHSAGGTTAAQAMYDDPRIDAAINLEGFLDYLPQQPGQPGELLPVAQNGVNRPLLLWGTDGFRNDRYARSWDAMLAHGGCTRWRQTNSASHGVFIDFAAMAPQMQAAGVLSAENRVKLIGAIDPAKSVPTIRNGVASFFDQHLRGEHHGR
jgi:dienelactone hydrolase